MKLEKMIDSFVPAGRKIFWQHPTKNALIEVKLSNDNKYLYFTRAGDVYRLVVRDIIDDVDKEIKKAQRKVKKSKK